MNWLYLGMDAANAANLVQSCEAGHGDDEDKELRRQLLPHAVEVYRAALVRLHYHAELALRGLAERKPV